VAESQLPPALHASPTVSRITGLVSPESLWSPASKMPACPGSASCFACPVRELRFQCGWEGRGSCAALAEQVLAAEGQACQEHRFCDELRQLKPHLLLSKETWYKVHLTADRKRNRMKRSIVWTTKAPPTTRAGP
jgi:hypothetical protein